MDSGGGGAELPPPSTAQAAPKQLPPPGDSAASPAPLQHRTKQAHDPAATPALQTQQPQPTIAPSSATAATTATTTAQKGKSSAAKPKTPPPAKNANATPAVASTAGRVSAAANSGGPGRMYCLCGELLPLFATRKLFNHLRWCKGSIKRRAHASVQQSANGRLKKGTNRIRAAASMDGGDDGEDGDADVNEVVDGDTDQVVDVDEEDEFDEEEYSSSDDDDGCTTPTTAQCTMLPLVTGGARFAADTSEEFDNIHNNIILQTAGASVGGGAGLPLSRPEDAMYDFPLFSDYALLAADQHALDEGQRCMDMARVSPTSRMTRPAVISVLRSDPLRDSLGLTFAAADNGGNGGDVGVDEPIDAEGSGGCRTIHVVPDGRKFERRGAGASSAPAAPSGDTPGEGSPKYLPRPSRSWRGHNACPRVFRCRWEYLSDAFDSDAPPQ